MDAVVKMLGTRSSKEIGQAAVQIDMRMFWRPVARTPSVSLRIRAA
ncbi:MULTISPECIES: hypothetical protein [Burkholderiaceae]|nr:MULTISPECIES: hypothetical protein [Burkholderiaceae]